MKICYAFIDTVGKLNIFDAFLNYYIFKNIIVVMSNFLIIRCSAVVSCINKNNL
jgi:hypothetical protein